MNLLLALALTTTASLDSASFAGGCFWSMERAFDQVPGVVSATVGYTGGTVPHPSYELVSTGQTGHLESVQVEYDPAKITYERLVDAFWHDIDPTQADGQFCDHGPEYHTAIFYRDTAQHRVAAASRRALEVRFGARVGRASRGRSRTGTSTGSPIARSSWHGRKYGQPTPIHIWAMCSTTARHRRACVIASTRPRCASFRWSACKQRDTSATCPCSRPRGADPVSLTPGACSRGQWCGLTVPSPCIPPPHHPRSTVSPSRAAPPVAGSSPV